jgi:hypothetical protein
MNYSSKKSKKQLSEIAKKHLLKEARFQGAVDAYLDADSNGVSLSEFVKAVVDGAADFLEDEAIYYDLDKASEIILKAIGRKDLIG